MTCMLCGSDLSDAPIVGTKARGGRDSRRVACARCSLVQVHPAPDTAALTAYYQGDYHKDHPPPGLMLCHADGSSPRFIPPDDPEYEQAVDLMHRSRAERVVRDLGLKPGDRVLEIGCAEGRTLYELQKRGMSVHGLEPDQAKCTLARMLCGALNVTWSDLAWRVENEPAVYGDPERFDAVIAFHVLEHFPDPLDALAKIRTLLKPGGKVWFEVPNVMQPDLPLEEHWQWVHLFDFSAETLQMLLECAGFDDVGVDGGTRQLVGLGKHRARTPCSLATDIMDGTAGTLVAAHLRSLETGEPIPATRNELRDLSSSVGRYADPAFDPLRAELARYQAAFRSLAEAYQQATMLVGELSWWADEESVARYESWVPEEWRHWFTMGEAHAFWRLKTMLAGLGNAMRTKELRDGGKK